MPFLYDATGFPTVAVPSLSLDVQLLPVTKIQFERFLADRPVHGDLWYQEVLAVNPRVGLPEVTPQNREGLLLTGILPEEAMEFAHWLGPGWGLPSVQQWRRIYRCFVEMVFRPQDVTDSIRHGMDRRARALVDTILLQVEQKTLATVTLMSGGVLEWVHDASQWGGLGSPRPVFAPNLFNPLLGPPVVPVDAEIRAKGFGFRLVREI